MEMSIPKENLSPKQKLVAACSKVLANEISILEAAREIARLRFDKEIDENDEDIITFVGIDSETDHLPIGKVRKLWNAEALSNKDKEIQDCEKWARDFGLKSCENLVTKYGN